MLSCRTSLLCIPGGCHPPFFLHPADLLLLYPPYIFHFCRIIAATIFPSVHFTAIRLPFSLCIFVASLRQPHPPFLRLLIRGDVFSVETVASAWGSGREGALGAPVSEENTSAIGSRASKQHTSLKTSAASLPLCIFVAYLRQPCSAPSHTRRPFIISSFHHSIIPSRPPSLTPALSYVLRQKHSFADGERKSMSGGHHVFCGAAYDTITNTSAIVFRASKQQKASEPQNSNPLVPIPAYPCLKRPILANKFAYIKNFSYLCTRF